MNLTQAAGESVNFNLSSIWLTPLTMSVEDVDEEKEKNDENTRQKMSFVLHFFPLI